MRSSSRPTPRPIRRASSRRPGASARALGMRHVIVATRGAGQPGLRAQPVNRCFFCKEELFATMAPLAAREGCRTLAYGATMDDLGDHRPGMERPPSGASAPRSSRPSCGRRRSASCRAASDCPPGTSRPSRACPPASSTATASPPRSSVRSTSPRSSCAAWASDSSAYATTTAWPASRCRARRCRASGRTGATTPSCAACASSDTCTSRWTWRASSPAARTCSSVSSGRARG